MAKTIRTHSNQINRYYALPNIRPKTKGEQLGARVEVRSFIVASFVILLEFDEAEKCRLKEFKFTFSGNAFIIGLPSDFKNFQILAGFSFSTQLWLCRRSTLLHTLLQWFVIVIYLSR